MSPTKRDIIDAIVGEATKRQFTGDRRDGDAPPIDLENFHTEIFRYGAKALRARLSRLSYIELLQVGADGVVFLEEERRFKHAAARRAHSQQQSERARRPRLQPAIYAAACHYRGLGKSAKDAWDAIAKSPYRTNGGEIVEIEGSKLSRSKQTIRVVSPDGRKLRHAIKFSQWRQRYWAAAAKPG